MKNLENTIVVFEGADGVGKETQTQLLYSRAFDAGLAVLRQSYPRYNTPVGQLLKAVLTDRVVLAENSRVISSAVGQTLSPDLARSDWNATVMQALHLLDKMEGFVTVRNFLRQQNGLVILDRWWPSTIAYGTADDLSDLYLLNLQDLLKLDSRTRVRYIVLDVDHAVVRTRKPIPDDKYEADLRKQQVVRDAYRRLAHSHGWPCIDCTELSPAEVHERVWSLL